MSPRIPRTAVSKRGGGEVGESGENVRVPAGTALVAAQRILALATESLDMMRNVMGVMKEVPILPSRNIITIVQPNLPITIYHLIRLIIRRLLLFGVLQVYLLHL